MQIQREHCVKTDNANIGCKPSKASKGRVTLRRRATPEQYTGRTRPALSDKGKSVTGGTGCPNTVKRVQKGRWGKQPGCLPRLDDPETLRRGGSPDTCGRIRSYGRGAMVIALANAFTPSPEVVGLNGDGRDGSIEPTRTWVMRRSDFR